MRHCGLDPQSPVFSGGSGLRRNDVKARSNHFLNCIYSDGRDQLRTKILSTAFQRTFCLHKQTFFGLSPFVSKFFCTFASPFLRFRFIIV